MRPLLSITFPQGFWISKNFGLLTLWSGSKKTFKGYLKREQTNRQRDRQMDTRTEISTYGKHQPREPMPWKYEYFKIKWLVWNASSGGLWYISILNIFNTWKIKRNKKQEQEAVSTPDTKQLQPLSYEQGWNIKPAHQCKNKIHSNNEQDHQRFLVDLILLIG